MIRLDLSCQTSRFYYAWNNLIIFRIKQKIGKTIIFVNHKRRSDRLAHALIAKGFSCMSINSDRSASQRLDALKGKNTLFSLISPILDLMTGAIDILVSTNVLARGLNIPRVDYIINYDLPNEFSGSEYVHRIGRCARLGNLGKSITLFNPSTDSYWSNDLIEGCKAANQHVPALLRDSVNIPKRSPLKYRRQNEEDHYARNQNPYYCGGKHSPSSSNCYGY
jgi:superfamily II DNA/RNA helicase